MRLIIFTLSALLAFAVAEREFNLCAREEKVCPGGVKPKTPCADGSQPRCPSGRTDTCKPKWKRCADRSEPVRQCATGKPHCPWTTKNRNHPWIIVHVSTLPPCVYIHGRSIDNVDITVSRLWGVTLMFIIQIETHFLLKRIFVSCHFHADRHCHFDFVFPNIGSGYITKKFHEHPSIGIFIIYHSFG